MLRIAIVDDEPAVRNLLEKYTHQHFAETGGKFSLDLYQDGEEPVSDYRSVYDVIFLNVQMNHLDGMTTAEKIRRLDEQMNLVFVTNMAQYAIKGYAVNAMDFVLKPITYFAFSQQLAKVNARMAQERREFVTIAVESGMMRLATEDIYYIESERHHLIFYTADDSFRTKGIMKSMEETLPSQRFFRCDNCYLVNLAHVDGVWQNSVALGAYQLQVSRPRKKEFLEALTNYIGGWR